MTEHKPDYATRAAIADKLAGPVPPGYKAYEPRPDIVVCETCLAADDHGNALVWREEIRSHEERLHLERIDRTGGFKYFSDLAAAVDSLDKCTDPSSAGDYKDDVVRAARALFEGWQPFDPPGMDQMIGAMLVMRKMNDADKATKAAQGPK